jgi:outer membrane protein assembly factor BamE
MTRSFLSFAKSALTTKLVSIAHCPLLLCLLISVSLVTACTTYDSATRRFASHLTPYKITIVQGNFVPREAAATLQVGMTRQQVRAALGSPLLTDIFHANRWDYIFYFKRGAKDIVERRALVLYFKGDRLTHWSGSNHLPSEHEMISAIDGERKR